MISRMTLARRAHTAATHLGVVVCAVVLLLMQSLSLLHAWQHGQFQATAADPLASSWRVGSSFEQVHPGAGLGPSHATHHDAWGHHAGDASCQLWLALGHASDHLAAQPVWVAPGTSAPASGPSRCSFDAFALAWAWPRAPPHFLHNLGVA